MTGTFITFEGGEGSGKTTQTWALAESLEKAGHSIVLTREPGGAQGAEQIRQLLVTGPPDKWSPLAETLLFYAARDDHLRNIIRPSLKEGKIVICDRFSDSTLAYQGAALSSLDKLLEVLELSVVGTTKPDITILLDIDPKTGLERAAIRGGDSVDENRFERKQLDYHEGLRAAFLKIAAKNKTRISTLDATLPSSVLETQIWQIVTKHLGEKS